ncbi:NAD(P)H-binding protein [Streptomyces avicenniae]|uniref:NmrA family NAD(P)-binding protein n=1 Tax=Streptomyces avicenniae TaxID=500153 RepID=UPI00069B77A5|nr:NAD(P)H-binding protein [Streptomyces avicenniae]
MTNPTDSPVLVLGATGKTGRRLVAALRAAGRPVRPASRSSPTRFDWHAPDTWPAALAGASAVYLVAPVEEEPVGRFVRQAVDAGVRRFVALSGRGIDRLPPSFAPGMLAGEEAVREHAPEWTVVRPNNFAQNFTEDLWHAPLRAGRLALPIGSTPEPFIDAQDIADVAAALLTGDGHHGQVYDLSGPRALTFGEAVAVIARAAGRDVAYEELTPEEYRGELLAAGASEAEAEGLGGMFAGMRAGHLAEPADGVRRVLGRAPVAFEEWAARAAAGGAWG